MEKRRVAQPNSRSLVGWRGVLLWRLGKQDDARQALALYEQMSEANLAPGLGLRAMAARLGLGERGELVEGIKRGLRPSASDTGSAIRFDPDFDSVRAEPWFQAFLAEADAKK